MVDLFPLIKMILLHTINIESYLPDGLFHIKSNGKTFTNWVFSEDHTEFCQPKIVCWQTFYLSYSIRSHKNNIYRSNKLVLSSCFEKQSQLYNHELSFDVICTNFLPIIFSIMFNFKNRKNSNFKNNSFVFQTNCKLMLLYLTYNYIVHCRNH